MTPLDTLMAGAIPIKEAVFHRTVKSFGASPAGEPETAFYSKGGKPSRTAAMYYTPAGLIVHQKHGKQIIPLANVVNAIFLNS